MDAATWIALIGTFLGGPAVIKFVEYILGRGKVKHDDAKAMREELRKEGETLKREAAELREEMRQVERQLDEWKEKYFTVLRDYLELRSQLAPREEEKRW